MSITILMVIRQELDKAIADSVPGSEQRKEALKLRGRLDIAEGNGFVDRPVENMLYDKQKPFVYSIDGGRMIYDPQNQSFELRDNEGKIVGGGAFTLREHNIFDKLVNCKDNEYTEIRPDLLYKLRRKLEPTKTGNDSIIKNVHGFRLVVSVDTVDKYPASPPIT